MSLGIKLALILGLIVGLIAAGWGGYNHAFDAGKAAGGAAVQTAWDADKAAIQKTTDEAIAKATSERDATLQANEGIVNDYNAQLSVVRGNAAALAQRLRDYQNRPAAASGSVPKAGDHSNTASASAIAAQEAGIYERLADYDAACQADAAQLNALIAQLKPQL